MMELFNIIAFEHSYSDRVTECYMFIVYIYCMFIVRAGEYISSLRSPVITGAI